MPPKGSIDKKIPIRKYHKIPFLDRPLQSILRFMQENRYMNEQSKISTNTEKESAPLLEDIENGMYYTIRNKYPYDPLSMKQMEIYGHTFSKESNADALHKISPIHISQPCGLPKINYQAVDVPHTQSVYSGPIGPLSFLRNTVPQPPDPTFMDFLNKI